MQQFIVSDVFPKNDAVETRLQDTTTRIEYVFRGEKAEKLKKLLKVYEEGKRAVETEFHIALNKLITE